MAKISRANINGRLDSLEHTETGFIPLTPNEINELNDAYDLHKKTGAFAKNKYGDFLRKFENRY